MRTPAAPPARPAIAMPRRSDASRARLPSQAPSRPRRRAAAPSTAPVMSPGEWPSSRLNASRPSSLTTPPTISPPSAPPTMHPAASADEARRGDPEADACAAHQRRRDGQPEQDEQHRDRAHAGLQRLRRAGEAVEQAADHARRRRPDRPGAAEQEELPPARRSAPVAQPPASPPAPLDRRDEAVAVLGHRLDEARARGVVAELPSQRLDALGQRLVGDRHAAPHLVEEAVLRDEPARLAHQQRQRVEIAGVELHRRIVARQLAVAGDRARNGRSESCRKSFFSKTSRLAHAAHRPLGHA